MLLSHTDKGAYMYYKVALDTKLNVWIELREQDVAVLVDVFIRHFFFFFLSY